MGKVRNHLTDQKMFIGSVEFNSIFQMHIVRLGFVNVNFQSHSSFLVRSDPH